ncbi:MAG: GNAT family N-acetyltransferase [Saccharospirillaceae bacterium]|nr:GNAT family N-acetyltransferase [Pseudomonadales bacterium]NRB77547.1 GNAT family N-acetyltransferase [Saccharospirillaceae bacterium]
MKIIKANIEDAQCILTIQKEAYLSEAVLNDDFNIPPLTQTIEQLKAEFSHKTILKIIINNKIIGSGQAQLKGTTCYIGRMAIINEFKGQGLGSKLLSVLETIYPEANCVELFTGLKSKSNLEMYNRRGYKQVREKLMGKTTVVFLEKTLKHNN